MMTMKTLKLLTYCIPTKPRAKYIVPWELKGVRKKLDKMKKASLLDKRNLKTSICKNLRNFRKN